MPEYYIKNDDGDLEPLRPANVEDINLIQSNISTAFIQLIIDNFGDAFILDDNENAFRLSPVENTSTAVTDQKNENGSGWKELNDLYVTQVLTLEKSSIQNLRLKFKNISTTTSINVTMEIRDLNEVLLGSYTLTVPSNTTEETEYIIPFGIHHLPAGDYTLKIKRTNASGVRIKYDANGTYGGKMAESPDDDTYNPLGTDLWFKEEYATQSTFDVVSGIAVIQGFKLYNLDTHVTISPASAYGDRIDLVVMKRDGTFEAIPGIAGTHPEAPEAPSGELKVAYITVYKNSPLAINMDIDQDETLSHTKPRSLKHRLGDVEQEVRYMMTKNPPKRIKYNLSGSSLINEAESPYMEWDSASSSWILSSHAIVRESWTLKDDINFTTDGIDHSDHTNGIIKLATTLYEEDTFSAGHGGSSRSVLGNKCQIYKNRAQISRYPAGFFSVSKGGYMRRIGLQPFWSVGTIEGGTLYLMQGNRIIEASAYLPISSWTSNNWEQNWFTFSGNTWLQPGEYYWVLLPTPSSSNRAGKLWIDTWYSHDSNYARVNNTYAEFMGWFPNITPSGYTGNGIVLASRPGRGVGFDVIQNCPGFVDKGTITSSAIDTGDGNGIATAMLDLNIRVPDGTYYKLEVSNDGGTTFYQMTGTKYTFSNQSGTNFVWRVTLYTNNRQKSPEIYFDYAKQYAVKVTLGLATGAGTPPTEGELVTKTFDGPRIVQYGLGLTESAESTESILLDRFSHWDWLRMWVDKNAGNVDVNFETSNDGSTWKIIKSGLTLEEIGQDSTLFGEDVDSDEYNYWCDLDANLLTDEEVVQACETAWSAAQEEVTCTADEENVEGTYSAKMEIGADATTGLISYKAKDLSMVNYDWIEIKVRSSIALNADDFAFRVCSDTEGTEIIEDYNIPAVTGDTWTTFRFQIKDPSLMDEIKSFGLEQVVDKGAMDFYIDSIKGIRIGLTTLEACETAWTSDKSPTATTSRDSVSPAQGTYSSKITWSSDPGTGLLEHIVESAGLDLRTFKQLRIWFKSSVNLENDDVSFLISDNDTCTSILEEHPLPAVAAAAGWTRITFDLDDPRLLNSIKSFGLKLNRSGLTSATINVDGIQGVTTLLTPFYQKYVRMRFEFSRENGNDISPSVHKIGVIPALM